MAAQHEIVAVEWREDRPFEVITCSETFCGTYDVEWSERYQCLYWHKSGGMPKQNVASPGAGLERLPPGVTTLEALCEHFEMVQSEAMYCQECKDWLPTDELCEHIVWDDEAGWWGGPGYLE